VSTERITITVPTDVLEELRREVGPGEVSGFVAEAIRERLKVDRVKELLAWLDEQYGPVPEDVKAEVDEWIREDVEYLTRVSSSSSLEATDEPDMP
jgi:hypothetical protein